MTNDHRRPFAYITTKSKTIASGGFTQMLTRAPWPAPANRYYILRKIDAQSPGTESAASGTAVVLWDQDLSSATPATRGSGGGPLYVVTIKPTLTSGGGTVSGALIGTNESTPSGIDTTPRIPFYAGITCTAPLNTTIQMELEVV